MKPAREYDRRVLALKTFSEQHGTEFGQFIDAVEKMVGTMRADKKYVTKYYKHAASRQLIKEARNGIQEGGLESKHVGLSGPLREAEEYGQHLDRSNPESATDHRQKLGELKDWAKRLHGHLDKIETGLQ